MIKAEGVSFSYTRVRPVLKEISFCLRPGELLGLIGPNGAGKSTLIRCLNNILTPCEGRVLLNGRDIRTYSRKTIAMNIGYVPQKHSATFPCKVIDVVMSGMGKPWSRAEAKEQAKEAVISLQRINMEDMALRNFTTLSGGEQQKVVIARVIASRTPVMLFDEPTSSLDICYQYQTLNIIKQMISTKAYSAVIAIHDLNIALKYCDRILLMDKGKIKAQGLSEQVMTQDNLLDTFGIETEFIRKEDQKFIVIKDAI